MGGPLGGCQHTMNAAHRHIGSVWLRESSEPRKEFITWENMEGLRLSPHRS